MPLPPLTTPELEPYTEPQIAFARRAWPLRAAEELRSALVFRALARASRVSRMPAEWSERFEAAVCDEVRHARLCASVGRALGATAPRYDAGPVRARLVNLSDAVTRASTLLLIEVAMGETVSMSLFRAGRRAAREPLTRVALESILRDEVRHQRLGWTGSTALWPSLTEAQRERLQLEATAALAAMEQQNAAPAFSRLAAGEAFDPAHAALGVLAPEARVEAFYVAVEHLVVPRLTRLGLDGPRAWETRYRLSAAVPLT
jgi:hypothetical protein